MYAVVKTGGKQYRVEQGDTIDVDLLGEPGSEVSLPAVLVVDGETVQATPAQLGSAHAKARVVAETRAPKIDGFVYKPKSNNRRRWGHRQPLARIEIIEIVKG